MLKYILLSVIIAVARSQIAPRDLVDKAQAELNQLENIVRGETIAAKDTLTDTATAFGTFTNNTYLEGLHDLQQEHDTIKSAVTAIKNLAQSVHVDISVCTDVQEQVLERLPGQYGDEIKDCLNTQSIVVQDIINDGYRIINVNLIKVAQLEDDFKKCNNNLLCIQPLLTQIELNKVRLPLNIKTEVNAVQGLLDKLKITVQECSTEKTAIYNARASDILNDVNACADRLLS